MSLLTNGQTAHSAASDRKHYCHRKEVDSPKGQKGVVLVGFMEYRNKQQRTLSTSSMVTQSWPVLS